MYKLLFNSILHIEKCNVFFVLNRRKGETFNGSVCWIWSLAGYISCVKAIVVRTEKADVAGRTKITTRVCD